MRQIGSELQREHGVIELQVFADVLADGGVRRQFEQPCAGVAYLQFAGRAQHALAFHAAQLPKLDLKRLTVGARRQLGSDCCAWHADAGTRIRRATHNMEQCSRANVHLAHAQTVCVGVLCNCLDFANHHAAERWRHRLQVFHFQACHGEGVGKLLGAQRRVAKGAQPGFRELHGGVKKSAASGLKLG